MGHFAVASYPTQLVVELVIFVSEVWGRLPRRCPLPSVRRNAYIRAGPLEDGCDDREYVGRPLRCFHRNRVRSQDLAEEIANGESMRSGLGIVRHVADYTGGPFRGSGESEAPSAS